jgi:hypothetical protein
MADEDERAFSPRAPLSAMVLRYGPVADNAPFVDALRRSLLGVEGGFTYTASDYELLDPLDFRVFFGGAGALDGVRPDAIKRGIAAGSEALLVVLLMSLDDEDAAGLVDEWTTFVADRERATLLAVSLATAEPPRIRDGAGGHVVALGLDALNERDVRRDLLSLHALNAALRLFSAGGGEKPKLFISHAKRDGVPLALSIRSWLKALEGLSFFYDTDNLDLQGDVSAQLEHAVSGSILIVLRTEIFDQRYWCQKEIYWAEKHGVPFLAVDGRWSLQHAPSVIVFDGSPSVRIPDGSITRILLAAMTEALRVSLFESRVRQTAGALGLDDAGWTTVPRFPGLGSLHSATDRLRTANPAGGKHYVIHPNPALPDELREVTCEMAAARLDGCKVLSLDELRVTLPSPP